jgi:hypothetical protein
MSLDESNPRIQPTTGRKAVDSLTVTRSLRLIFERCEGNTLVVRFKRFVHGEAWNSENAYEVAGARITEVELDRSGETLRLVTNKAWKEGEKTTVRYPAFPGGPSERTAELSFIVTAGRPVGEEPLVEFLCQNP